MTTTKTEENDTTDAFKQVFRGDHLSNKANAGRTIKKKKAISSNHEFTTWEQVFFFVAIAGFIIIAICACTSTKGKKIVLCSPNDKDCTECGLYPNRSNDAWRRLERTIYCLTHMKEMRSNEHTPRGIGIYVICSTFANTDNTTHPWVIHRQLVDYLEGEPYTSQQYNEIFECLLLGSIYKHIPTCEYYN